MKHNNAIQYVDFETNVWQIGYKNQLTTVLEILNLAVTNEKLLI